MQRRDFIRILGGGSIGAALPLLAGCSQAMPADALQAWAGPAAGDEPRRWALAHAILAPNPHNRQAWAVDLKEPQQIVLWVDGERVLPQTDPLGRQVMVGQGAFIELLAMALAERGLKAQVELFPAGEPGPNAADLAAKPVARVRWAEGAARDPLFAQIRRRHTPKSDYDTTRPVAPEHVLALAAAVGAHAQVQPVRFGSALDMAQVEPMRQLCWESAKVELLTPRTVMESVHLLRVGPAEIAQHRDGISVTSPMARVAAALGQFDRTNPPTEGSSGYKQMMSRFDGHSRSAMGFVWLATADGSRASQVQAGRAFVRMQLEATRIGLGVHPMSQALQEFPEMAPHYEQAHRLTLGRAAPRSVQDPVLQMFCRIGWPKVPAGPTPRRELQQFVLTV